MRKVKYKECEIYKTEWWDIHGQYCHPLNEKTPYMRRAYIPSDTILCITYDNVDYFGTFYEGGIYISSILWVLGGYIELQLNRLIKEGLSPYQALEILEL